MYRQRLQTRHGILIVNPLQGHLVLQVGGGGSRYLEVDTFKKSKDEPKARVVSLMIEGWCQSWFAPTRFETCSMLSAVVVVPRVVAQRLLQLALC